MSDMWSEARATIKHVLDGVGVDDDTRALASEIVNAALPAFAAAVRAEAVAEERRKATRVRHELERLALDAMLLEPTSAALRLASYVDHLERSLSSGS